jgi:excisionase family DNA binding protein
MGKNEGTVDEKFLRPDEIAKQLDVEVETVRAWLRRGELTGYKLGNDWRVKPTDLQSFLEKRRNTKEEQ